MTTAWNGVSSPSSTSRYKDMETITQDERVIIIVEQPYFDEPTARHIVTVGDDEVRREYLWFRDPRKGQRARREDASIGAGRYFYRERICCRIRPETNSEDGLPETRHASFASFLEAVGYDWKSNSYHRIKQAA